MATGRLGTGAIAIPATTLTPVYTAPSGYYSVVNVSITNRNSTSVTIQMALSTGLTANPEEYIEYNTVIVGNGVFERTGLVIQAGINILVYSSTANVGCTTYGIETSTS